VLKIIALIVPLGLDSFVIGASLGVAGLPENRRVRVSLVFAAFEAGMPLVGLALGAPLGHAIGDVADYIAIGILIAFGLYTLFSDAAEEEAKVSELSTSSGLAMIALGLSVSLDELAIGFTLGLLRVPVLPVLIAIAAQAFVMSQLGLRVGARLGERVREGAERLGGIALTTVGAVLLAEKLLV
jgi:putative Mn2+ efflux pump MntP